MSVTGSSCHICNWLVVFLPAKTWLEPVDHLLVGNLCPWLVDQLSVEISHNIIIPYYEVWKPQKSWRRSYTWWFRNPAITSWYWEYVQIFSLGFHRYPKPKLPSTVSEAISPKKKNTTQMFQDIGDCETPQSLKKTNQQINPSDQWKNVAVHWEENKQFSIWVFPQNTPK